MGLKRTATICITTSFAVHAAAFVQFATPQDMLAASGPPPALVTAGNSFADMVMGAPATQLPDPVQPAQPAVSSPEAVEEVEIVNASITLEPTEITDAAAEIYASTTAQPELQQAQPVENTSVTPPVMRVVPEVQTIAPQPTETTAAPTPERLQPEPEEEQIAEEAPETAPRPSARPTDLARTPPPERQAPPAPEVAVATGSAQQDAVRGADTPSQVESDQHASGHAQQPDEAAIAGAQEAIASYPNRVVSAIIQTRRDRTRARGMTVVSFDIGSAGQLTSVQVARSSGDRELDRMALSHIRRTAPFPTPPQGARTSYTFEFQGR
ncbi:protein TonB [Monaibacterium marinum]|uniref:Protein TonB n=1 Tax=Pontivivens marinum TaxID=1690039 RepID=A0A2C9CQH4_9RHOB|nr:TonB family protein [Monaibacterium marinum]SOH93801.1 protein TonB [Monaibacterium marinum]